MGNIALVFAAQMCRDSEIAGFPIRIYYGIAIGISYGISIAFTIRSVDHSLFIRLILPFMRCFGDCLNHRFSRIKRITRITGALSRSLSSRLILLLSKIKLVFSPIVVSNTTYAAPAGRDSEIGSLWSYKGDHNLTDCGTESIISLDCGCYFTRRSKTRNSRQRKVYVGVMLNALAIHQDRV